MKGNGKTIKNQICTWLKKLFRRGWVIICLIGSTLALPSGSARAASIDGGVFDLSGNPLPQVEIQLSGDSNFLAVTNSTGGFFIGGLADSGNFQLTARFSGRVFTPSTVTYNAIVGAQTGQNFIFGKTWSGSAGDGLASSSANWVGGLAPLQNDAILFGSTGATTAATWDLNLTLSSFTTTSNYQSNITFGTDLDVHSIEIGGGNVAFQDREHFLSGNFVHTGGTFTFSQNGTLRFDGSSAQTVQMLTQQTGSNQYASYFYNYRIFNSSSVRALSDLIIDGGFTMTSGEFKAGGSTLTLSGGAQTSVGSGPALNWDDNSGTFTHESGLIRFSNTFRSYRINQGALNRFNNIDIVGTNSVDLISKLLVNGDLRIQNTGASPQLNVGDLHNVTVSGDAWIGPLSTPTNEAFTIANSTAIFQGEVRIATAAVGISGGHFAVNGSTLHVASQGTLAIKSGNTGKIALGNGTLFHVENGTFRNSEISILQSTSPATGTYSTYFNGTIEIPRPISISELDFNGLRFGPNAVINSLTNIYFYKGTAGGYALNFDPVSQSTLTIQAPNFDSTISTNVRARIDPAVQSSADIRVIDPEGARSSYLYEQDPNDVIHWGIIGTPTNLNGTALGISSITWTWDIQNEPLGFRLFSSTGGQISPTLGPNATYFTETGLTINAAANRLLEAFTDVSVASTSLMTRYTLSQPAGTLNISQVQITSVTFSWGVGANPTDTNYRVDRSTDGVNFSTAGLGPFNTFQPFTDSGLSPFTNYTFRLIALNGDGVASSTGVVVSTRTLPVPPPIIFSISPSTGSNLGSFSFTVEGVNFQSNASLVIRRSPTQSRTPTSLSQLDSNTFTGTVNLTGALANTWDVFVTNQDGTQSTGTGEDILLITNASSQGDYTIVDYLTTEGANFSTTDGQTSFTFAEGAMSNGRIYVTVDPETSPLSIDPNDITAATALETRTLIPGSIREVRTYISNGPYESDFSQDVFMSIFYPDTDGNEVLDNVVIRSNSLIVMLLDEVTGRWRPISGSTVNGTGKNVTAEINKPGVYALFGQPASNDLSQVRIYPNPWKAGSEGLYDAQRITINNLTASGTLRIYTIQGVLIHEKSFGSNQAGIYFWDGKNDSGDNVASGVYLIRIESSSGESRVFKLGVER